ncbi:MAG: protocatechuate 3,4-dioxygenase subunit alpha [Herminiimonas sp.]|nr:protocatechuate 3,4-dioxygenase subunit alpha [Herminiimonas sp.]
MSLQMTASQTVGPFLHIGFDGTYVSDLTAAAGASLAGERIVIEGCVTDGTGGTVPDGLIEIWQANAQGRYAHPDDTRALPLDAGFTGFGRVATDEQGRFRFVTIKPGRVPDASGALQAPHIMVSVFMRGLIKRLATRIYFPDDPANAEDGVLARIPAARRATLIACAVAGQAGALNWNVVVQGSAGNADETVFFDL